MKMIVATFYLALLLGATDARASARVPNASRFSVGPLRRCSKAQSAQAKPSATNCAFAQASE